MKPTNEIYDALLNEYDNPVPELKFSTAYELLVAVILSAQCTDKRVNEVTKELFKKYNTPKSMLTLSNHELEQKIFSCGFYRNKAKHILEASYDILEKFNGEVPSTLSELMTLSGVGRKTANVVYAVWFKGNAIAVDTHVFRVSNRIGIAKAKDVLNTEKQLMEAFSEDKWSVLHHLLIYHGRRVCHSRKPECNKCVINQYCDFFKEQKWTRY